MNRWMAGILIMAGLRTMTGLAQTTNVLTSNPAPYRYEVALSYSALHANAPPAGCTCFWLNGGTAQLSANLTKNIAGVAEFGLEKASNVGPGSYNLTLSTFLVGARYAYKPATRFSPYGQILVGADHASTNNSVDNGSNSLALSAGGGLNYRLNQRFSWRVVQADYLLTHVPNAGNNRQNQLRLATGIVFHF